MALDDFQLPQAVKAPLPHVSEIAQAKTQLYVHLFSARLQQRPQNFEVASGLVANAAKVKQFHSDSAV